ncbi:hypothetical protein KSS87_011490, partial [Heliosperma pusillum]
KERKDKLAKLEVLDTGKPWDKAVSDIDEVASCFEYYADQAEALDAKQKAPLALPMDTFKAHVLKQPLGVVGLITPWNYPLLMAAWKVAPALAAGCTAVLKPSELASLTSADLSPIAFTGSTATGSKIMALAAQLVKPVTLELGGKSPIIVFDDAELDKGNFYAAFPCPSPITSSILVATSVPLSVLGKLSVECLISTTEEEDADATHQHLRYFSVCC